MLDFLNLFAATSLREFMKLQATSKQIQNTKFVLNFVLLTTLKIAVFKQRISHFSL